MAQVCIQFKKWKCKNITSHQSINEPVAFYKHISQIFVEKCYANQTIYCF